MAGMRHADSRQSADDNVAVIPMIETVEAIGNLDDILSVPGIDAIYVGPADLAISLGLGPSGNEGTPVFDDALATWPRPEVTMPTAIRPTACTDRAAS